MTIITIIEKSHFNSYLLLLSLAYQKVSLQFNVAVYESLRLLDNSVKQDTYGIHQVLGLVYPINIDQIQANF